MPQHKRQKVVEKDRVPEKELETLEIKEKSMDASNSVLQRRVLKEMRGDETLTSSEYRYYYRKAKGGSYRSVAHMRTNMGLDGIKIGGDE